MQIEFDDKEIIVADSDRDTVLHLNDAYPFVKTVILKKNYGVAKNTNLAVDHAHGEYLLVSQNDFYVNPHFVTKAINVLEHDKKGGIVTGYFYQNGKILHGLKIHRFTGSVYVSGVCFVTRTKLAKKIRFDENIFFGCEDVDYSRNFMLNGYRLYEINEFMGVHLGGSTWQRFSSLRRIYFFNKSRLYLLIKWRCKPFFKFFSRILRQVAYELLRRR